MLFVPLAAYGLGMMWRTVDRRAQHATLAGVLAVCLAGVACTALYNVIFFAILPDSQTLKPTSRPSA